jgi:hypothetical protein
VVNGKAPSAIHERISRPIALGAQVLEDPSAAPTPWIERCADLFQSKTGMRPFPKTLVVTLDMPWEPPQSSLRFDLPGGTVVACVPCEVDRIKGFMVQTDNDGNPSTVVEVVATVDLAHDLALQGGDCIEVVVDRRDALNVVSARRLVVLTSVGIAMLVLGALFGIVAVLTSLKVAGTALLLGVIVVGGVLWSARFFRQASTLPYSAPLHWPSWPTRRK